MKRIIRNPINISIIASMIILFFDYYKIKLLNLAYNADSAVGEASLKLLAFIPYCLYIILAIWFVFHIFTKTNVLKWRAFIPATIIALTVLIVIYFPYSNAFAKLNYNINKDRYAEIIQMYHNGELEHYRDVTYKVPYEFVSYTGFVYTQNNNDVTKVRFDIYEGCSGQALL